MSSHHIVREKQEPALLVLSLEGFSFEHLGQLLEWSPTVIATAHTAEKLFADGIKLDMIISDEPVTIGQLNIRWLKTEADNELQTALNFLAENDYRAVNIIIGVWDGSINLAILSKFINNIDIVIYTGNEKIYPIKSGFSKWKPAGEELRLLAPALDLHCEGLKKITETVYRTEKAGFFCIRFTTPVILIAEVYN